MILSLIAAVALQAVERRPTRAEISKAVVDANVKDVTEVTAFARQLKLDHAFSDLCRQRAIAEYRVAFATDLPVYIDVEEADTVSQLESMARIRSGFMIASQKLCLKQAEKTLRD